MHYLPSSFLESYVIGVSLPSCTEKAVGSSQVPFIKPQTKLFSCLVPLGATHCLHKKDHHLAFVQPQHVFPVPPTITSLSLRYSNKNATALYPHILHIAVWRLELPSFYFGSLEVNHSFKAQIKYLHETEIPIDSKISVLAISTKLHVFSQNMYSILLFSFLEYKLL